MVSNPNAAILKQKNASRRVRGVNKYASRGFFDVRFPIVFSRNRINMVQITILSMIGFRLNFRNPAYTDTMNIKKRLRVMEMVSIM